ncbi:spore wall protein 2-like [Asterias rubens]|uniref:spore wall protein 2-like n=1 Tax=Asterias rubens TaxID=7604 RepID=UPI0014557DB2|nr:spore wall protein 2-like [Asterias rubens]
MEGCGCGVIRVIISPIVIVYLFLTLGAADTVDSIFPACKERTHAIKIPNLVDPNPCIFRCPTKVEMACANDGTSHINECFLCKDACNNPDRPIFKVCNGRCPCKGKPHDDVMKTVDDCKDGKCAVDASDHYDEDYGLDVEAPEAKYSYPEYTREQYENGDVIHELDGYSQRGDEEMVDGGYGYTEDEELREWEYYEEEYEDIEVEGDDDAEVEEEEDVEGEGEEGEDTLQEGEGRDGGAGDGVVDHKEEGKEKVKEVIVDMEEDGGQGKGNNQKGPETGKEGEGVPQKGSKKAREEQVKDKQIKVVVENKEDIIS